MEKHTGNPSDPAGQDADLSMRERGAEQAPVSGSGTATGAAAAMQPNAQGGTSSEGRPPDYVDVGAAFTQWFNSKVPQLVNPTVQLGTKQASVLRLHPDGKLECTIHGEGQTFVAFEPQYLDQLVRRIAAIGR